MSCPSATTPVTGAITSLTGATTSLTGATTSLTGATSDNRRYHVRNRSNRIGIGGGEARVGVCAASL